MRSTTSSPTRVEQDRLLNAGYDLLADGSHRVVWEKFLGRHHYGMVMFDYVLHRWHWALQGVSGHDYGGGSATSVDDAMARAWAAFERSL